MRRPVIGIGTEISPAGDGKRERVFAPARYLESVERAGGVPLLVAPIGADASEILQRVDGLVLPGGNDCDPALYGEEAHPSVVLMDRRRQSVDLALARGAAERGLPTLGVCLGMQIMCVARGGSLIQDLPSVDPALTRHKSGGSERSRHRVEVSSGSALARILGEGTHEVNSSHHQAVREPGRGMVVVATADDGVIEAFEERSGRFQIGVQWHPEDMPGERAGDALFEALVEAARAWRARSGGSED